MPHKQMRYQTGTASAAFNRSKSSFGTTQSGKASSSNSQAMQGAASRLNKSRVRTARSVAASKSSGVTPSPKTPPQPQVNIVEQGESSPSGATTVFLLLILLMVFAEWKNVVAPTLDLIWNPGSKNKMVDIPFKGMLGMMFLIAIAVFISSVSSNGAKLMIGFAVALLIVYLVENNGGGFTSLFNFFSNKPGK